MRENYHSSEAQYPQYKNRCSKCGEWWWDAHVCPAQHIEITSNTVVINLTETDVRRIAREELKKLLGNI